MTTHPALLAAQRHAEMMAPHESCGLLVDRGDGALYIACPNQHPTPRDAFTIDPRLVTSAQAKHHLKAVIHSHPHPHPPEPSAKDRAGQMAMGVPWAVIPVDAQGVAGAPVWIGREAQDG